VTDKNWKITDLFTGEEKPVEIFRNEPTQEWIEGWNAGMNGDDRNPYEPGCVQHGDWQEGHDDAEMD